MSAPNPAVAGQRVTVCARLRQVQTKAAWLTEYFPPPSSPRDGEVDIPERLFIAESTDLMSPVSPRTWVEDIKPFPQPLGTVSLRVHGDKDDLHTP
jgi:hypothetical protein